ncbi:hypothetical protein F5884DRAFT_896932 [Xylogone sp. PMI_703]|nr:hypothetical protein F5884DRAFT_896932 [Xylogone sp. PMI_703]
MLSGYISPLLQPFIFLLFSAPSLATPLINTNVNSTITLPPEASNHGDPNLICVPTRWTDVAVFFLGNYLAHAATVIGRPGACFLDTTLDGIRALLFPVWGVNRGLNALFSFAILAKTAARAGALCEVIEREGGEGAKGGRPKIYLLQPWVSGSIYGRVSLPPGYGLAILPADAEFGNDVEDSLPIKLSSSYNAVRILVSIGQLVFASSTLYRSRGDQIQRYGYAAFGLTVTQYALMSLLNLLGTLVCPQYSALYLVESSVMDEARRVTGTVIEGTVGRLTETHTERTRQRPHRQSNDMKWWKSKQQWIRLPVALAPTAISVLIIWALSRFQVRESTLAQRVWVITWLVVGSVIGLAGAEVRGEDITVEHSRRELMIRCFQICIGAAPAIGGFIVVGQMLHDYGVCNLIS